MTTERKWKIQKISNNDPLLSGWYLIPPWGHTALVLRTFEDAICAVTRDYVALNYQSVLLND